MELQSPLYSGTNDLHRASAKGLIYFALLNDHTVWFPAGSLGEFDPLDVATMTIDIQTHSQPPGAIEPTSVVATIAADGSGWLTFVQDNSQLYSVKWTFTPMFVYSV